VAKKTAEVIKKTEEVNKTLDNVLQGLANVIEHRDLESGEHVKRTQLYVGALARHLIFSRSKYAEELLELQPEIIVKSMALHDVGKIAIPDRILLKPGRLDPEEYEIMKKHTTIGYDMCRNDVKLRPYGAGALYHHESLNGTRIPSRTY